MSVSYETNYGAFLRSLIVLCALVALLAPQIVCAESLLMLYKEDSSNTVLWQETSHQSTKQPAVVSLNENGDLMVKYGSVSMILAYNPPEEPYKQQEPVRMAMVMNQEAPAISGISIKVNFTF